MKRYPHLAAIGLAALLLCTGARAEVMQLLCAQANGQYPEVVNVDFGASTANGFKAKITDSEIRWQSNAVDANNKALVYEYRINRLNGDYNSYTRGLVYASPPPQITCKKAPQRQF